MSLDNDFPMGWYSNTSFKLGPHPHLCRWCHDPLLVVNNHARMCALCDGPDVTEEKRGR